jgi:hypothetical protein
VTTIRRDSGRAGMGAVAPGMDNVPAGGAQLRSDVIGRGPYAEVHGFSCGSEAAAGGDRPDSQGTRQGATDEFGVRQIELYHNTDAVLDHVGQNAKRHQASLLTPPRHAPYAA